MERLTIVQGDTLNVKTEKSDIVTCLNYNLCSVKQRAKVIQCVSIIVKNGEC